MPELLNFEPRGLLRELHVDVQNSPGGLVSLPATSAHRLRIHAGASVRGRCRAQRFVYTRSDVDIFPAGLSDSWQQEGDSRFLVLSVAPSLLRRAAEEVRLPVTPRRSRAATSVS